MSDLQYKSVEELTEIKKDTEAYIAKLSSKLNGQKQRLEWINKYLYEKTTQEMTIKDIENALGHKVIIKGDNSL